MVRVTPAERTFPVVENLIADSKDMVREAQLAFVRRVLDRTGITQTELATRIQRDPSTLSKFLSGKARRGHTLTAETITAIEQVTGIAFAENVGASLAPKGFGEPDASPYQAAVRAGDLMDAMLRTLTDQNAVDAWVMKSRALESIGILPGDILIVDLNAAPRSGQIVCAQIYDWPNNQARTVMRLYESPFLVAATQDRGLMRPHLVDNDDVIIRGVVGPTIRPAIQA